MFYLSFLFINFIGGFKKKMLLQSKKNEYITEHDMIYNYSIILNNQYLSKKMSHECVKN